MTNENTTPETMPLRTPYLIAMLHLAGDSPESRFERMKRETAILYKNGFDAVLVENYYGSVSDCETALAWLQDTYPDKTYGVNILGNESKSFALAAKYHASFIQIDSVAGSLLPNQEEAYDYQLQLLREEHSVCILGGVRFKGHEVFSGRSLKGDLEAGMTRCNAVVVTGNATGEDTPTSKIKKYRNIIGNFPLIVGAGVTADTVAEKLKIADGVIVGSWLKEGHTAQGEIREDYVKEFVRKAKGKIFCQPPNHTADT